MWQVSAYECICISRIGGMATACELDSVSSHMISSYLLAHSEPAQGALKCQPARSLGHGDVYLLSRGIATAVRRILEREVCHMRAQRLAARIRS